MAGAESLLTAWQARAGAPPAPRRPGRDPLVLLAEPDAAQRDLATLALERLRCRVVTAADGPEAQRQFEKRRPDLLILEVMLPRKNGLDVLHDLRTSGLLGRTPVIVLSALGFREVVERAGKAGATGFIVKPMDVRRMVDEVSKSLRLEAGGGD